MGRFNIRDEMKDNSSVSRAWPAPQAEAPIMPGTDNLPGRRACRSVILNPKGMKGILGVSCGFLGSVLPTFGTRETYTLLQISC